MGDLKPGTNHSIEIFPQGPNGTEGPSQTVTSRTGKQVGCALCHTVMVLEGNQNNL
jgi:hypothetical protein